MRQKPTLVILTLDFFPEIGGVQNYLFEVAQRLSKKCHTIVISPTQTDASAPDRPFSQVTLKSTETRNVWQQLRKLKPDIVLVGHAHPQLLLPAKIHGNYGLITHGNDFLAAQTRWHKPLFNYLVKKAKPLITNSKSNGQKLNKLGIQPDFIIHPGTDPNRFFPKNIMVTGPPTLLTIARLVPRKGIDTVLHTLPKLLQSFPELIYKIGGQGPDFARLQSLATRLNVSTSVEFLGTLSGNELSETYRTADIFVMPAREEKNQTSIEGFGIVFLEASASGLPIVASRSGGISEAVIDGKTGLLVESDNVSDLGNVLTLLLQSPEKRTLLGQNGRRWVEKSMNWDQTAIKLANALGIDVT